jgi:hypothetical protein
VRFGKPVVSNFSPLPHLDLAAARHELPAPNEGPVQWRERWDFILTPVQDSLALGEPVQAFADLQYDLPDRLTMMQDGEVTGVVTGQVHAGPLTGPQGTALARGVVTLVVGNVAPARAIALELCWTAPDGRYCMLNGHGNGVTADSLNGIQLALRLSWRKESPMEALGQSMTFLLTRVARPSQLPPPPPPPDTLWQRLVGIFARKN